MNKYLYQLWGGVGILWHQLTNKHNAANTEDGSWICFDCEAIWKSPLFDTVGRPVIEKAILRVSKNPSGRKLYLKTLENFLKKDSK